MKKYILIFFISSIICAQGDLLWNRSGNDLPSGGTSWSTPLYMNNKIFWAGQDKGFAALNAETGEILWENTSDFMNGTYDSPSGYDGIVVISRNNYSDPTAKSLLALNAETGAVIWQKNNFYTANRSAKPITQNGNLYAATNDTLYCFNLHNGAVIWKKAEKYSNLMIDYNGMRLIAAKANSASIEIMFPNNGELRTTIDLTDTDVSIASMAYTYYQSKEYLVVAPGTKEKPVFYCVDLASESIVWSSDKIGYVGNKSMPVIYQDKVFAGIEKPAGSEPQEIVAFSLSNGNVLWRNYARGNGAANTPFVVALDGKVFYHNSEYGLNLILAADMSDGNIIWGTTTQFENPWPLVWGSPLLVNNKIYVVKDHEGIFRFDAGTVAGEWTMHGGNIHATNSFTPALVSVDENEPVVPADYTLMQNYPNPFNPSTIISYNLLKSSHVVLEVFNQLGQKVSTLVNEFKSSGQHSVSFNAAIGKGQELSSGVYFYQLRTADYFVTKKMVLLR